MRRLNPLLVHILQDWGFYENKKIGLEYSPITPIGKMLHSPGRSTRQGIGPRYEPDPIAKRVGDAFDLICSGDKLLIGCRYRDGMSDRIIGLICHVSEGKARWAMEIAHRSIAKKLEIPVYK